MKSLRTFLLYRILGSLTASTCFTTPAAAFDPTALAGAMGVFNQMEGATDVGFALSDLLKETGISPEEDKELREAITRLDDLREKARSLNWSSSQIHEALSQDLAKANSIQNKIRALHSMVEASKRIAEIMQVRPKAGEKAVSIQEIRIQSMVLDELQSMRKFQMLEHLRIREAEAKRVLYIENLKKSAESERKSHVSF